MATDRPGPMGLNWNDVDNHLGSVGDEHLQARREIEDSANDRHGFLNSYFDLRRRRLGQVTVDYTASTISSFGMPAPTLTASITGSQKNARGDFVTLATNGSVNDWCGIVSPAYFERRMDPAFSTMIRTSPSSTSLSRHWVGMFNANPNAVAPSTAGSTGALSAIAFAWDTTDFGTAFWRVVTSDGSSQTVTDTGVALTTNTHYALDIECDNLSTPEVRFYIDGALVHRETSTLVSGTTALNWAWTHTNLGAASRTIRAGITTLTKAG